MRLELIFVLSGLLVIAPFALILLLHLRAWRREQRSRYISSYAFPQEVLEQLRKQSHYSNKQQSQICAALRQYFRLLTLSGRELPQPSRAVDQLWQCFMRCPREYRAFCRKAFGHYLKHRPHVSAASIAEDRGVWQAGWVFACLDERLDSRCTTHIPLLFALDMKLGLSAAMTREQLAGLLTVAQADAPYLQGGSEGNALSGGNDCHASGGGDGSSDCGSSGGGGCD